MESKAMKILIIEDDIDDCNRFVNCIKERKDIELVGITDSDTEGLKYVKLKHPEGIVLDLELNNSTPSPSPFRHSWRCLLPSLCPCLCSKNCAYA